MNENIKKPVYIAIALAVFLILAGCTLVKFLNYRVAIDNVLNLNVNKLVSDANILRRKIDGKILDTPEKTNLYPVAIMIENNLEAWPLAGLDKANVVIEAPVESNIPRFVAIYANSEQIEKIGPVRSARPYYLDWVAPYDPLYMHVGGSPEALQLLKTYNVVNLDQYFNDQYYWRDNWRYAPHNVYTSSEKIREAIVAKQLVSPTDYQTWSYKDDLALDKRPDQSNDIVVNYTAGEYQAKWQYEKQANDYLRYQGGDVMKMSDGSRILAKNVIIEVHNIVVIDNIGRKKITTIGSGKALIFRDGQVVIGIWSKDDVNSATRYLDDKGNDIQLNGGTTWLEIVQNEDILRY
ncbi:MAG: DUF3048 domain-containing protein [Patescibacteria group bacterium]|nr:DUF3048 domain-containing protein [Patescibacteria group bacterium]